MLDSDIANADSQLHVEFYLSEEERYKGVPFVRIIVPGDKTNVVEQPVREDHKERFPRQWLYFQMKAQEGGVIGTPLSEWHQAAPDEINRGQMEELNILKFQSVEQLATASDAQLQRFGMGATGLREKARMFLARKNRTDSQVELDETKKQLAELQEQMKDLLAASKRGPGRPPKQEG
jgi:hypothetical protein